MTTTTRSRRTRALVVASATALALSAVPAASAQEEDPAETDTGVVCDAEAFDDEDDDFPFYFVEPGETLTCTAFGLDPETDAEWIVEVYGATEDEFELEFGGDEEDWDLEDEEPYETFGSDGPQTPTEDGELTFEFTIPEELIVGGFDGTVWQGDDEDPTYEEFFGGLIFGFFLGDMECDDPAVRGEQTDCVAELNPGEFEWEVYELTVRDLLDEFFGDPFADEGDDGEYEEIEPSASGTGLADGEGFAPFSFSLAVDGDAEIFIAVASQDDAVAFYAGEIEPADDTEPAPPREPAETDEDDDAPVAVRRPNRVEAGAGGAAPAGGVPTGGVALTLGLALTAAAVVRRSVTEGR